MRGRSRSQPDAVIPSAETKEAFLRALDEARKLAVASGREVRFGCPLHRALDAFKADVDQLAFFLTGRNEYFHAPLPTAQSTPRQQPGE